MRRFVNYTLRTWAPDGPANPIRHVIRDRYLECDGCYLFHHSRVLDGGKALELVYACGVRYRITLGSLLNFELTPQFELKEGRWRNQEEWMFKKNVYVELPLLRYNADLRVQAIRSSGHVVRIYFNNGLAFAAMHDYFLEILEPSYEAFGGMAEEQHKFVTNIYASMKMDVRRELRRRDVNVSNFGAFHACHISADKSEVTFVMPTQDRYLVSATELIAWRGQHGSVVPEMNRRGKHAERRECENCPSAFLSTFRYGPEKRAVRMHFTDGIPYDVDWETVLIHCDDRYERYRGPLSGNLEHFNVDMR